MRLIGKNNIIQKLNELKIKTNHFTEFYTEPGCQYRVGVAGWGYFEICGKKFYFSVIIKSLDIAVYEHCIEVKGKTILKTKLQREINTWNPLLIKELNKWMLGK